MNVFMSEDLLIDLQMNADIKTNRPFVTLDVCTPCKGRLWDVHVSNFEYKDRDFYVNDEGTVKIYV